MLDRLSLVALFVVGSAASNTSHLGTTLGTAPCSSTSVACCNPSASPAQYCPGAILCQSCGGGTACECPTSGPTPAPAPAPTPAPAPAPTPSPSPTPLPCGSTGKPCCDPNTTPAQYCAGNIKCQPCGGGDACECPASGPTPGPTPGPGPSPPPCGPSPSNPLGICPLPARSDNFFLIIGDWGTPRPQSAWPYASGGCQDRVAQMMNDYVAKYKAQGKRCLFVSSVGDNFYSTGVKDQAHWESQWSNVYGTNDPNRPLYNIPWLSVMGNHDHGNDDPYCACGRGCKQFNGASPSGTEKYWMPNYYYNYVVPGVDLEVIALDTNALDVGGLGGNGCSGGASLTCQVCGGQGNMQSFLSGQKSAGESFLDQRARATTAKTALIMQHYDGSTGKDYKNRFQSVQQAAGNEPTAILSAYGHAHDQVCQGSGANGCDVILTGGGGGWQGGSYFGFTAVHLKDDGGFETVLETSEVRFPQGSCAYLNHEHESNETRSELSEVLV